MNNAAQANAFLVDLQSSSCFIPTADMSVTLHTVVLPFSFSKEKVITDISNRYFQLESFVMVILHRSLEKSLFCLLLLPQCKDGHAIGPADHVNAIRIKVPVKTFITASAKFY